MRTLRFAPAMTGALAASTLLLAACGGGADNAADTSANAALDADPMFEEGTGANDVTAIDAAAMGNQSMVGAGPDLANAADSGAMTNDMTSDAMANVTVNGN